jgi:hypothetical protein
VIRNIINNHVSIASIEVNNIPENKTSGPLSSITQENKLHGNNTSNTTSHRNTPPGSYTFKRKK